MEAVIEGDLISLEEVRMWSTDALKEFCRKRGYKVSGTRDELCSRVYVLYNNQTPEEPGAKEKEASLRTDYKKLYQTGSTSSDPLKLSKWIGEKEGMKMWPPVSFVEVVKFINKHGHSLASETLTSYKTGKAFGYFDSDWLGEVFYHQINKTQKHCYLKANCTPSNRLNDEPHCSWIKVDKSSGEIVSAYCSCVAGLSQTCNHVAAVLFKVESAFRLDISNPACTSTSCSWKAPSSKTPVFMKLCDMDFKKPSHRRGKAGPSVSGQPKQYSTVHASESLVEQSDDKPYKDFIKELHSSLPTALIFLPGTISSNQSQEHTIISDDAYSTLDNADVMAVAESCHSVSDLLENITITDAKVTEVERLTLGQAENPLWIRARKGRLTASIFYKVYTKVESLKKRPATDCSKLTDSILDPPSLLHVPHIAAGSTMEATAQKAFQAELTDIGHKNVVIDSCGLYISQEMPFLGASPDGLVRCSCCEEVRLLEIKCPSKTVEQLPYLDDNKLLKKKTAYYGQVQGQLAITGMTHSYFYVYTESSTCCDMIKKDKKFCETMLKNLELFYTQFLGPAILRKAHDVKKRKLIT